MSDTPALTLDQFAKITVWLRAGTKRKRALAEAEIDTATWLGAQIYWLGRMASLVANGDTALHARFLARTATLESEGVGKLPPLAAGGATLEPRLAPLRERSIVADVGSGAGAAPAVTPHVPAVPPAVAIHGPPPKISMSSTIDGPSPWAPPEAPAAALPFVSKKVAPKDVSPPAQAAPITPPTINPSIAEVGVRSEQIAMPAFPDMMEASASVSRTTSAMPAFPSMAQVTPFKTTGAGSPKPAAGAEPDSAELADEDSSSLYGTLDMDPSDAPALPFVAGGPPPAATPQTVPEVDPSAPEPSDDDPLLGTMEMSPEEAMQAMKKAMASMPFGVDEQTRDAAAGAQVGGTPFNAVSAKPPAAEPAAAEPAAAAAAPPAPDAPTITLEQYAWLVAAIQAAPDRTESTLAMLSLTPQKKVAIDRHFEALFKADSSQRQAFVRACMQYQKKS